MEEFDVVVVGAGWFGLAAAKVFHEINPDKSLLVLEADPTLGGTWSRDRLYPGLKTNNMLGTLEYPDFPMDTQTFGVKPGEHIPGEVIHNYLTSYADKFDILDRIRYNAKVESADHQRAGGWVLTVRGIGSSSARVLARKLIVATGLTSEPILPHIDGQESFGAPVFHGRDLRQFVNTPKEPHKRATVFGGTKFGWDAVYAYAIKGIQVDWVIRQSGHGPAWMAPPYVTPFKRWLEKLVNTRLLTWFSPCIWGFADGFSRIRWFWHETRIGRAITNTFWSILGNDVMTLNKYDAHPETAKLKPWSHAMFTGTSFSILNYETNFFDLLKNGSVKVHIADITGLSPHKVHLSNGRDLESDGLCCVTGWKHVPPMKFLPDGIEKEIGLPHTPSADDRDDLVQRADAEIFAKFPRLRDQPIQNRHYQPLGDNKGISTDEKLEPGRDLTSYNLYRFMVPASPSLLKHRDLALAGMLTTFSTCLLSHIQALWISAYFRDEVSLPDWTDPTIMEKMLYETVVYNRFGKWRYPGGRGAQHPDFVFDAVPYFDLLQKDLGLEIHRKKGVLAEMLEPYGPPDYRNVVAEWMEGRDALEPRVL